MGYMTFEDFKAEVSLNLGDVMPAPPRLALWVNFAYYQILLNEKNKFEELTKKSTFTTVIDTQTITYPTDAIGIRTIELHGIKLRKMDREYTSEELEEGGQPTHYMRRNSGIILWPIPDDEYDGTIEYVYIPTRMSASTDLSILPAPWDLVIVQMATYRALTALGKHSEAVAWRADMSQTVESILSERKVSQSAIREGLQVAWSFDDLVDNPPHLPDR